jgi:hypothetical protein
MVPWDVYIMPKKEGVLGLNDVAIQRSILATKWVAKGLEGATPQQGLLRHNANSPSYIKHHILKVSGPFGLCDIILSPHLFHIIGSFICQSIW